MKEEMIHQKNTPLYHIGEVYEQAEGKKLSPALFKAIEPHLESLAEYFDTTKAQAFIVSLIFALSYKQCSIGIGDIVDYLDCNPMKFLAFTNDFRLLFEKKLIQNEAFGTFGSDNDDLSECEFVISSIVSKAILGNTAIHKEDEKSCKNEIELLSEIYKLCRKREENDAYSFVLFSQVESLLSKYQNFPLVQKIKQLKLNYINKCIFLAIIWKGLGNETLDLEEVFDLILDDKTQKIEYMQEVAKKSNELIKKGLLRTESGNFFNDTQFILSEKSIQLLEECQLSLTFNTESKNDCIAPENIVTKGLFFSKEQTQKFQLLKRLLVEDQYKEIQNRLKEKGLPCGITLLFHGVPGTGKTEMVKQLAKLSNRELMKVNISQAKSKWFGESEKEVKLIFDEYKKYAKSAKRTPILFFNEADALISRRTSNASNQQFNTQQTENALQNILLDELENFEGILAATTNMVENLDGAFDRRFLYKMKFDKPALAIRSKIWKEKLPTLTQQQCESLADSFHLTGGQIDNIVRKMEIEEIITGNVLKYERIISNCADELLRQRNNEQIGFKPQ